MKLMEQNKSTAMVELMCMADQLVEHLYTPAKNQPLVHRISVCVPYDLLLLIIFVHDPMLR